MKAELKITCEKDLKLLEAFLNYYSDTVSFNENSLLSGTRIVGLAAIDFELKILSDRGASFPCKEVSEAIDIMRDAGFHQFIVEAGKGLPLVIRGVDTGLKLMIAGLTEPVESDKTETD